jgi:hypothetical protein
MVKMNVAAVAAEEEAEEQWATLDEEQVDDVELLRYIIKMQRLKIESCKTRVAVCEVKVIFVLQLHD